MFKKDQRVWFAINGKLYMGNVKRAVDDDSQAVVVRSVEGIWSVPVVDVIDASAKPSEDWMKARISQEAKTV